MRVALFVPCFVDALDPETGMACARILRRLGHEVVYPERQTCCGQPALNAGHFAEFLRTARRQLDALAEANADAVVCPSGSCVAALRKVGPHQAGLDHPLLPRLFELTEFLVDELGVIDLGAKFDGTVTWHDACHPLRELGIRDGPRRLLAAVEGLELVEMDPSDECCGFGGLFSVKLPEVSAGMGDRKIAAIEATGADFVASTETSCLLHIDGMLARRGRDVRGLHIAKILGGEA
ncbi:MAG: (Fe-S)-binding protein [Planctomycetota bacterium]